MNWACCLKIEKQEFQVRYKMILPFIQLADCSETRAGSYVTGARSNRVSAALPWYLVSCLSVVTPWSSASAQGKRLSPGLTSVLKWSSKSQRRALHCLYTTLQWNRFLLFISGSAFSFIRNQTSFGITFSYCLLPHEFWLTFASLPFPVFSLLSPLYCVFPNFLVSFFCYICYKMHLLIGVLLL